jgi:mannose-1-phosphate guanylyltransferase
VSRWAVVLAGGVGSRFWPLSTPERPKQLLPLVTDQPMLVDSVQRLSPFIPLGRTLILTSRALAPAIAGMLPGLPPGNIVAEPKAAGTAPALAWAAKLIAERDSPEAVMVSVHADWAVADPESFRETLERAARVAEREQSLVTVGIVPSRPDPGFGYIAPGDAVNDARRVREFVEKPNVDRARGMVAEGYLWNSGIFVWRVGDFLGEARAHCPEIAGALEQAGADIGEFFSAATPISVDHGVLERSDRVLVLPGDFGWDDVGTWAALQRVRTPDNAQNALSGDVVTLEARNNVVHAEGSTVVLYGVSNLVVVTRAGLTLVTTTDRAAELKTLVDALPAAVRDRS